MILRRSGPRARSAQTPDGQQGGSTARRYAEFDVVDFRGGDSEHTDVTAAAAQTQRRLIFDGTKFPDVVEQLNRNNRRQLIIDSASLAGYHVSGTYSSTDPSSLVRFLREQPGFKITETDNEVRIAAR